MGWSDISRLIFFNGARMRIIFNKRSGLKWGCSVRTIVIPILNFCFQQDWKYKASIPCSKLTEKEVQQWRMIHDSSIKTRNWHQKEKEKKQCVWFIPGWLWPPCKTNGHGGHNSTCFVREKSMASHPTPTVWEKIPILKKDEDDYKSVQMSFFYTSIMCSFHSFSLIHRLNLKGSSFHLPNLSRFEFLIY